MNDHKFDSLFSHDPTPEDVFDAHLFEEPLVPVGADPTPAENVALAKALTAYANRSGTDDFTSLTGFLERYPRCAWNVALLTNLGLEYYSGGHYSKTLSAWGQAWTLGRAATDLKGKAIVDRAVGELAYMYARLGLTIYVDHSLGKLSRRFLRHVVSNALENLMRVFAQNFLSIHCENGATDAAISAKRQSSQKIRTSIPAADRRSIRTASVPVLWFISRFKKAVKNATKGH